jgi:hypothetical protein
MLQAKVQKEIGKKDEAVKTYKKALLVAEGNEEECCVQSINKLTNAEVVGVTQQSSLIEKVRVFLLTRFTLTGRRLVLLMLMVLGLLVLGKRVIVRMFAKR